MSDRKFGRRYGWAAIILLIILAAVYFIVTRAGPGTLPSLIPATIAQPVGDLPILPDKSQPEQITFNKCPPEGSGGDRELNLLENRIDVGSYVPVSFDTITTLTWPKSVEQLELKDWPSEGRAFIAQYAGIPISVEGYFGSVKEDAPSAANCNINNSTNKDWSIFLTKNARDELYTAVIVSVTPRIRANHGKWTLDLLRSTVINDHLLVRVSGWLLFNPTHAQDVGKTRATLWEIHPVMQIEVFNNGKWVALDKFAE